MAKPLYIVWQDEFLQAEPILNEQHRGVLASINSLYYFLQQGHGLEALMPTVDICMSYIQFHATTEEALLREASYPNMETFIAENNKIIVDFKVICHEAINHKDPELVLHFLADWWLDHIEFHKRTARYLRDSA
jgi:hemerythrin